MYRRPTVFVSQAPYQNYNRVVPPPAHNGSNRQVNYRSDCDCDCICYHI